MKANRRRIKNVGKENGNLWRDSVTYLKESSRFIYLIIGIFFLSAIVGFVFNNNFVFFDDLIRNLVSNIEGKGLFGLMWFIFQNNIMAAFLGMIMGIAFGIMPVVNAVTNGLLLGYVYQKTSEAVGYGSIWLLVPHGIFELPAVFIALGMGMKLGMSFFTRKGNRKREFVKRLKGSIKAFICIVLPLLIIAAVIEGTLIFLGR